MEAASGETLRIDDSTLAGWQNIVDIMAEICRAPAGLVMRVNDDSIEVFASSRTPGNPYHPGDREKLAGSGLYCEHVIRTRSPLHVPDALADPAWRNNPDVRLNMISYHGYPILAPDGSVFGTICALDTKPRPLEALYDRLLNIFKDHIEHDLADIQRAREMEKRNVELAAALARVQTLEGILPICQYCKKIRVEGGDANDPGAWTRVETYIAQRSGARFSHGICPSCFREFHTGAPQEASAP